MRNITMGKRQKRENCAGNLPHDLCSVRFGESTFLRNTFKKLATDSQFEREVVFLARFEPFVEFDLFEKKK